MYQNEIWKNPTFNICLSNYAYEMFTWQKVSHPNKLLLQQAPPSNSQPELLFSSSHHWSLAHWGDPQLGNVVNVDAVVVDVDAVVVDVDAVVVDVDTVVFVIPKHSQTCMKLTFIFLIITIRINNM